MSEFIIDASDRVFENDQTNDIRIFSDGNGGESIEIGQIIGYLPKNWESVPRGELVEYVGEEVKQFVIASLTAYLNKHEF